MLRTSAAAAREPGTSGRPRRRAARSKLGRGSRRLASRQRRQMLRLFERHPAFFHRVVTRMPVAWKMFADFCRGRTSPAQLVRNPVARALLRTLPRQAAARMLGEHD